MRNVDWSVGEATRLCTVRSLWANNMRDVQHETVCAYRFPAIALRYDRRLFFFRWLICSRMAEKSDDPCVCPKQIILHLVATHKANKRTTNVNMVNGRPLFPCWAHKFVLWCLQNDLVITQFWPGSCAVHSCTAKSIITFNILRMRMVYSCLIC